MCSSPMLVIGGPTPYSHHVVVHCLASIFTHVCVRVRVRVRVGNSVHACAYILWHSYINVCTRVQLCLIIYGCRACVHAKH